MYTNTRKGSKSKGKFPPRPKNKLQLIFSSGSLYPFVWMVAITQGTYFGFDIFCLAIEPKLLASN